ADAIAAGKVRSCHDLAEGGLAVAAAEMAIGGGLGVRIDPDAIVCGEEIARTDVKLFSETPTRFLLEVEEEFGLGTVVGEVTETDIDFGSAGKVSLEDARDAFFCWEKIL
ncbi:MAG: AIR synthase-related protein, partial [Planctomycetota bacterium]